jgi:hypothetical protein
MCVAFWINKATDTHPEYTILIVFPQQQWLRERASLLGYTYIACVAIMLIFLQEHFLLMRFQL